MADSPDVGSAPLSNDTLSEVAKMDGLSLDDSSVNESPLSNDALSEVARMDGLPLDDSSVNESPLSNDTLSEVAKMDGLSLDDSSVDESPLPRVRYFLTPVYDDENNEMVKALNVGVVLPEGSNVGSILAYSFTRNNNIELSRLDLDSVSAHDSLGALDITHNITQSGGPITEMEWRVSRPPKGPVGVSYTYLPRVVDRTTANSSPSDLRQEFGGLSGTGFSFLLVPQSGYDPDEGFLDFEITLSWELAGAPPGTSSAWTLGAGPGPFTYRANFDEFCQTYFMVGKIDTLSREGVGFYCLGDSPVHKESMLFQVWRMFNYASRFFCDDLESSKNDTEDYRVFLRHNVYPGTMIATAPGRSFVVTHHADEHGEPRPVEAYLTTLHHELIHNWVRLDGGETWFCEGLAEFYGLILPQYAGFESREKFRLSLNSILTMYYTNPLVGYSNTAASKAATVFWNASQIPYGRGLLFALKLDALIRGHDKTGNYSIDTVVQTIIFQQRYDGYGGLPEFLEVLGKLLPGGLQQAKRLHKDMASGVLVVPAENSLAHLGLQVIRRDAPIWELGFDESAASSGNRVVQNLDPNSAAAECDVREGDVIIASSCFHDTKAEEHRSLDLVVQRGENEQLSKSFRPRGQQLVERWIYVEGKEL